MKQARFKPPREWVREILRRKKMIRRFVTESCKGK